MKTLSRDQRIVLLLQKENPLLARVLQRVGAESEKKTRDTFPRKNRRTKK